jgi:hypothetical protein
MCGIYIYILLLLLLLLWLYSALLGLGHFFSFLILYTVCITPWMGDQPIAYIYIYIYIYIYKIKVALCMYKGWARNPAQWSIEGCTIWHISLTNILSFRFPICNHLVHYIHYGFMKITDILHGLYSPSTLVHKFQNHQYNNNNY